MSTKTKPISSRLTPVQRAKQRLMAAAASELSAPTTTQNPENSLASTASAETVVEATPSAATAVIFKEWRIQTFADLSEVDDWFQDKLIHILNHLLRKGRIMKRKLVEFTYPEKGMVRIVWQDIATGDLIHEPAPDSPFSDEVDPLA